MRRHLLESTYHTSRHRFSVAALFFFLLGPTVEGAEWFGCHSSIPDYHCTFSDGLEMWQSSTRDDDKPIFFRLLEAAYGIVLPSSIPLPFGKSIALLVGVSRYQSDRDDVQHYPDLPFVENDLLRMRDTLLEKAGFDVVYVLTGEDVNASKLKDAVLNQLRHVLTRDDRFLFYFAGHGDDAPGSRIGLLVFPGADPALLGSDYFLNLYELYLWSDAIEARHVLFILDSCSSGLVGVPQARRGSAGNLLNALTGSGSRTVVTAGTAGQQTYEYEGNGVFTKALIESIEERARSSPSGFYTIEDVVAATKNKVGAFASRHPREVDALQPDIWRFDKAEYDGTFVFLNPDGDLSPDEEAALVRGTVRPVARQGQQAPSPPVAPDVVSLDFTATTGLYLSSKYSSYDAMDSAGRDEAKRLAIEGIIDRCDNEFGGTIALILNEEGSYSGERARQYSWTVSATCEYQ